MVKTRSNSCDLIWSTVDGTSDASVISLSTTDDQKNFEVHLMPRGQSAAEETTPPTLLIIYPDSNEILYTLGQKGTTDNGAIQPLGEVTSWTSRIGADSLGALPASNRHIEFSPTNDPQYRHKYVSGTSLCVWSVNGVTQILAYWAQHESRAYAGRDDIDYGKKRLIASSTQRFCTSGVVSTDGITWGNTVALDATAVPSADVVDLGTSFTIPGATIGPVIGPDTTIQIGLVTIGPGDILNLVPPALRASETVILNNIWPVGFAIADIDGDTKPDLLWCYLKKASPDTNEQTFDVYYTIGKNVDASGLPAIPGATEISAGISLQDPILGIVENDPNDQKGGTDITQNGLKVAIATLPGTTRNFLVVAAVLKSNPTSARLYAVEIDINGSPIGSVLERNGPTSTVDGVPTGVGLAFTSLRDNDQLDAVVFYLMRPTIGGEAAGEYFVNTSWRLDAPPENGWSGGYKVGDNVDPQKSDMWFGGQTGGAAIAVADTDGNGRQDLIVFHDVYGGAPSTAGQGGVDGFYRIGYNFTFYKITLVQCTHDNFKPVAGQVPLLFSGFEVLDLEIGNAIQATKTSRNYVYVEEAFYFAPVLVALQLQSAAEYIAALDWFRLVYDYTLPVQLRRLVGLAPQITNDGFQRDDPAVQGDEYDWLLDPLNPHSIARTRRNTYLRYTELAIIKCFLDYADSEYTTDNSESVPRARTLYRRALDLLNTDELKPASDTCEGVRGDLEITFADRWSDYLTDVIPPSVTMSIGQMQQLSASLSKVFSRYAGTDSLLAKAREAAAKLQPPRTAEIRVGASLAQTQAATAQVQAAFMSDPQFSARIDGLAGKFSTLQPGTGPNGGYGPIGNGANGFEVIPWPSGDITLPPIDPMIVSFCVPQNPILQTLRLRANLNLYKIRNCRNISGLERELDPYAAATDTQTGLPSIGPGGQLQLPGTTSIRPTPYRYQTLIDRAKQLVQIAMQIEQGYVAALEKSAAEDYAMLKARQDLSVSAAGVRLQELQVIEAQGSVTLANLQRERANIQVASYEGWINAGLIASEVAMITAYSISAASQAGAAIASGALSVASASDPAAVAGAAITKASFDAAAALAQGVASVASAIASFERKKEEWELSLRLAQQDVAISDQQIDIAEDHVRVTQQQQTIAQMQHDYNQQTVDYLAGKFTNKELYDWMSGVLEGVYSFFLQQATAMAQLAQGQLAFERQQAPPSSSSPTTGRRRRSGSADGPLSTTDRRGLTGSARLLQDIYQLDQYAFDTNQRKLQLTKTISLAQLDPYGFQRFRETGVLGFATPMELFDRDFPGHYLRLIKRVRTSVIALIPPNQGIRATLSSTGLSRVVIGGDIFQTVSLRRGPETMALSSPINATGLFDLESSRRATCCCRSRASASTPSGSSGC